MKKVIATLLTLALPALAWGVQPRERERGGGPHHAIAVLHGTGGHEKIHGVIWFTQQGNHVEIMGEINGLTPGTHAFHIHEFGDCSAPDAMSAGAHYNPTNMPHGSPEHGQRH